MFRIIFKLFGVLLVGTDLTHGVKPKLQHDITSFRDDDEEGKVDICFHPDDPEVKDYVNFNPPETIPEEFSERIYSISAGMQLTQPVVAFICYAGSNRMIDEDHRYFTDQKFNRFSYFKVSSVSDEPTGPDDYSGQLCSITFIREIGEFDMSFPVRFDPTLQAAITCGNPGKIGTPGIPPSLPNLLQGTGAVMIAQGLMHTTPAARRKFKFELFETESSAKPVAINFTHAFTVDKPVHELRWSSKQLTTIVANQPFDITLEITDKDGEVFNTGFGSTLMVEVTLSYKHKFFFKTGPKAGFLYRTKAVIAGKDVKISKGTNDRVLQKRAVGGIAHFTDVRILNTTDGTTLQLSLNATLLMPRGLWKRVPENYSDFECLIEKTASEVIDQSRSSFQSRHEGEFLEKVKDENQIFYTYDENCNISSSAVVLSQPISVERQRAEKFVLKQNFGSVKKPVFSANFRIQGISYEVRDNSGNKIYSGKDSELKIIVSTVPSNVKIEFSSTSDLLNGEGVFHGSIVEVVDSVKLCFSVINYTNKKLDEQCTIQFKVTGEIHLAFFGNLKAAGVITNADPLTETFARFAVEDINDGLGAEMLQDILPVLPNDRKFVMTGYDTKMDLYTTIQKLERMIFNGEAEPSKKVRMIIGFMSVYLVENMFSKFTREKIVCIGLRGSMMRAVGSLSFYLPFAYPETNYLEIITELCKDRGWTTVDVLRSETGGLSETIFQFLDTNDIHTLEDLYFVDIPQKEWTEKLYSYELMRVKSSSTRVIIFIVRAPLQYFIMRQAIKLKIAPIDGYQWIIAIQPARDFLSSLENPYCNMNGEMSCLEAFTGAMLLFAVDQPNYSSVLWQHVHQRYFAINRAKNRGDPIVYPKYHSSAFSAGYDAVVLFAHVIADAIRNNRTIIEEDIVARMLEKEFEGLTGRVRFENNARMGFMMSLISLRSDLSTKDRKSSRTSRVQVSRNLTTTVIDGRKVIVEVLCQSVIDTVRDTGQDLAIMTTPVTKFKQKHYFYSRVGIVSRHDQKLILPLNQSEIDNLHPIVRIVDISKGFSKESLLKNPNTLVMRREFVIMSYYCEDGCGGRILSEFDGNNYANGICVSQGKCKCKTVQDITPNVPQRYWKNKAYRGPNCDIAQCTLCLKGRCFGPELCLCDSGYTGFACSTAVCTDGCGEGKCIAPGICKCPPGQIGKACNIYIMVLIGPFIVIFAIMICCCFNLYIHWRKTVELNRLSTMTDWLVKWEDVNFINDNKRESILTGHSLPGTAKSSGFQSKNFFGGTSDGEIITNVVYWQSQKCFVQMLHCPTVDLQIRNIRMEITYLSQLRHPNIAGFIGVCLEEPYTSVLVDYYPKGSLTDILQQRTIPLDWDVKFSLMKDIARGMNYLHNSSIESHGQLKSSNCLMDNRWTIRLTGFGIPTIRRTKQSSEILSSSNALLWTAPELLRAHDRLQDVLPGTKWGDVYSFGIIISEICTGELPYALERHILSSEEIIMLIISSSDPANKGLKASWVAHGGNLNEYVRPSINRIYLPQEDVEAIFLTKLMADCWNEYSLSRPSFNDVLYKLNSMKSVKGDLMDSLIKRLEEYSVKLESQFVEASKELKTEKEKLEELLGRLLPKKIVEDMIHGKKVEAEEFEMVTVCFSDIADFVSMTKSLSPYDVMNMLNQLYVCFDDIIDNFDAYKVETVRDEYMVVSGLPVRNGCLHASEIAMVALHLMSTVVSFQSDRRQSISRLIMLRIGIHSGPCVAGVVGLQMPRYCLFGDTINAASRMKTSSNALQIQLSENTASILEVVGGFQYDYHGEREVKGRGKMKTYWLTGADGFMKELPNPKLAVPKELQSYK